MFTSPAFPRRTFRTWAALRSAERYAEATARVRELLSAAQAERTDRRAGTARVAPFTREVGADLSGDARIVALLAEAATLRPSLAPAVDAARAGDMMTAFRIADRFVRDAMASQGRGRREAADFLSMEF